jgi:hypothetical protein
MKRLLPGLGVLVFLGLLVASDVGTMWRAAELYGRPWVYLAWKLLEGGTLPALLAAIGALFFFGAVQRSIRVALLVPLSMFAAFGLVCVLAAVPITNSLFGSFTPAGQGMVGRVLHSAAEFRSRVPSVLVITVGRDGNPGDQVPAFVSDGLMQYGTVELGTDRFGKTWIVEPPVSGSIRSQGWFLLIIAALASLVTFAVAGPLRRRSRRPDDDTGAPPGNR